MERQRNPAVKWGLIFGGLLILLELINLGIEYATGTLQAAATATPGPSAFASMNLGASLVQGCVVFLIEVALYFVAGLLTARENGRVGSGAVAGVIAGALEGVVGAIIAVTTLLLRPLPALPANVRMTPETYHTVTIVAGIIVAVLGLGIAIGIGAGIAALGGLVGRSQYAASHQAPLMSESYYTPLAAAPGYPVHPQGAFPPAPGTVPPAESPAGYPPQYPPQYPPMPGQYPPPSSESAPPPYPPQNPQNPQQ